MKITPKRLVIAAILLVASVAAAQAAVKLDTSKRTVVVGAGTAGSAAGGVVTVQGSASGTAIPVSGTITATAAGQAADGAAVSGNPVRIAGKDGSGNTQDILTDTSGLLRLEGSAASGAAAGGTWAAPTLVSCSTGTASSATLVAGQVYEMTADIDMFIRPAATSTTSWRPLWAKTYLYARQVATGGGAGVIACITATGTGTLYLTPITTAE